MYSSDTRLTYNYNSHLLFLSSSDVSRRYVVLNTRLGCRSRYDHIGPRSLKVPTNEDDSGLVSVRDIKGTDVEDTESGLYLEDNCRKTKR